MAIKSGYSSEDLARLGPDALTRRRMLAEALLAKSAGQRKIEHPLQGAAQMAEALVNGLDVRRLDNAESEGMKSGESAWSSLFGGSNGSAPSAAMPATTGAGQELTATSPAAAQPLDMSGNEVFGQFIDTVKQGGVQNPYALSAIAATGKAESGFDPKNATRTWSDPSESGQPGTAGGIMSWRGPRYQALAATGDLSPAGQAKFFLQENPQLIQALNSAKSVEEAQSLMNNAWKFAGYDRPGGEASRRLQLASSFLPTFQNREVASASPQAAMEAAAPASGYVDPMVSAPNAQPQLMAAIPPSGGMPPLEPPRTIGTPAVPPNAPPPQQLAQALTGNAPPPQQQGPSVQDLAKILSNPWVSDDKKKIAQVLLGKKLEQEDPMRRLQLEREQLEIERLRNPRLSPAEQERLDLERQKFDFERNKPKDPTKVSQGEILVDPATGKEIYKAPPKAEAKPSAVQEYEYAKNQGFPGTFQDWEASKKGGMSLQVDPATGAVTFQQGGNIKPMTEGQSKDAVFSTRAAGALPLIDKFGDSLTGMEGVVGGTVGQLPVVGNFAKTEGYQQAEQAGKEFLQAILRKDTGAAITKEETAEYGSVYLPRPGDSKELLAQKKASRTRALEAIKAGMPPQAIIAQEKALANTAKAIDTPPEGIDPEDWKFMDEGQRKLFR